MEVWDSPFAFYVWMWGAGFFFSCFMHLFAWHFGIAWVREWFGEPAGGRRFER